MCVCVCGGWSTPCIAALVRLSLIAGVVVLKSSAEPHGAGGGKLNKHHPRQECFHSEQLSACPVYLLHNYHPPQGNSMEQHNHPLGDEEGPRRRRDGRIPQREIADRILLCVSSWK